jgi:hypothetical protein
LQFRTLQTGSSIIGLVKLTDGTNSPASIASGTYGKPLVVTNPHDIVTYSDGYSNTTTNYVDENYNQITQGVFTFVFNGASWDRVRSVANATNSIGTGIIAAGILAQYDDTSPTSITENKFGNLRMSANRNLYNTIRDAAGNERGANVDASNNLMVNVNSALPNGTNLLGKVGIDQTTPGTTNGVSLAQIGGTTIVNGGVAGSQSIGGTVATNVAITANPLNLGAQAVSSENTAVTATRMAQLVTDIVGKLIVLPYANPENFVSGVISTAMTGTTSTSLIAAPASGLRNYITQITVSNSHASVGTDILIQDGSGGTTLYVIPAAAAYGGATLTFPTPLRQPTTATAIYCANVTTGSSIKVSASGYKGA